MTRSVAGPPTRRLRPQRRRSLLAFVEGRCTEDQYLTHWRRQLRDRVTLRIDPYHGSAQQLVGRAMAALDQERREARRGCGTPYDEIWCVFDHDGRPEVMEAITRAEQSGIKLAFSNPCIEFWFALHFDHYGSWVTATEIQRRAANLLGCDKNLTVAALNMLSARYERAREAAKAIARAHRTHGARPDENPSTTLWKLIESMHGSQPSE